MVRAFSKTLRELDLQFDGGIHAQHLEVEYPKSKIESFIVQDHLGNMTDDPLIRPNVLKLIEKIIEPNEFKIVSLTLKIYRRNI